MQRFESVHKKNETEFLDDALFRVFNSVDLNKKSEATLEAAAAQEPLLKESFKTPQSPKYHAEGPFLIDHLHSMLVVLNALSDEQLHLIDIEEFRAIRGYEGEIEEMEEIIKENHALFETFILCHDVGKWETARFESKDGTRGKTLGFDMPKGLHQNELVQSDRAKLRERYLDLYETFAKEHSIESPNDIQSQFYLTYQIDIHYGGHERVIHTPQYRSLLSRIGTAKSLEPKAIKVLEDIISHHLAPLNSFERVNPSGIDLYVKMAESRGFDADDFIDLFQGAVLLDIVCGSAKRGPHGYWHDPNILINFLKSEYEFLPDKRQKKIEERKQELKKQQIQAFKRSGLDGVSLMELLEMEPGPQFGSTLKHIQAAILGKEPLPRFSDKIDTELDRRTEKFYELWFEKDL